ncbi:AAA family ATPase [Sphingomonas sp. DT-204]|uniref:AAA family ATPase n=1 Tax=Sphingomonas sp. DT-204 TaxID=3396166 RepID=UPI003F198E2A
MNDATPRRLSGSLLERAAAIYNFAPAAIPDVIESQPVPVPVLDPEPVPEPMIRTGFAADGPVVRRVAAIDREALAAGGLLVPEAPVTALAEEFRLVKRHLLLTARQIAGSDARKSRTILVCSARPDDGKTFCAVNLALSLAAEKDVEVVLADADFAKPDILDRLGIDARGPGLLDALADAALDIEECIIDTDVPRLSVLSAGAHTNSDTELLASGHARVVLERLASASPRRIVIFDSPPALSASSAPVLAGHVGQVALVVRADRTSESELRDAVALLDGCEHLQLVINSVAFQPGGRRFGGYYGQESAA